MKRICPMIVTSHLDTKNPPPFTPEELQMLNELDKYPIVFDEDCPEQTSEQLAKFKRVTPRRESSV